MAKSIRRCLATFTICQVLAAGGQIAATQQGQVQTDRSAQIKALTEQLRWHNKAERELYEARREDSTRALFKEIDTYVSGALPASATAQQVKAGVDALLGRKEGDGLHDLAFVTDLASGHFLLVGIELWRGGAAINEDAVSFRAYKESDGKFEYVASIDALTGSGDGVSGPALVDLNAEALKSPPVDDEFWFIAWADVPPQSPYTVIMRLYAFNGKHFRTVWAPANIISSGVNDAVQPTPDGRGFVVNQIQNPQSPTIVHERYFLTADGPQPVSESTSNRE